MPPKSGPDHTQTTDPTMKAYVFVITLLLGTVAAAPALAQSDDRADRRVERLAERLDLTEAQQQQLTALFARHRADAEAQRDARQAQRQTLDAEVQALLTPEQAETFATPKGEQRGYRKGLRHGARMERTRDRGSRSGLRSGLRGLDLTDAQQTQLRELRDHQRTEAQAWRDANPDATTEQRRAFQERLRDASQDELKRILTDEQLEKLEQRRERGPRGRRMR